MLKNGLFWGFSTLSEFWRKSKSLMVTFEGLKWKLRLFLNSPRKLHVQENSGSFLTLFAVKEVCNFWMILSVLGQFLRFRQSDGLHFAYSDNTKCLQQFGNYISYTGSFKDHENAFLNDPKSQKVGFWSFSGLGSVGSTWHCIFWQN